MPSRYPLTIDQFRDMKRDLAEMQIRATEMLNLMVAGCGESDPRTIRAEELAALDGPLESLDGGGQTSAAGSHARALRV